uniref:SET domain-containing protein n=1 Tax=Setaria digitata TaxID=48799 RepID=A0A915PHI5_9BILA
MVGRNRLSSSGKGVFFDDGNELNALEQEDIPMEMLTNSSMESLSSSSVSSHYPTRPKKPRTSSIAIAEKDDPRKFRIYRPLNHGPFLSTIYYRCSKCESLEKKSIGKVNRKRYAPYVRTLRGKLIGNAHPEHHPDCHAITKEIEELQEMDRACRAKIKIDGYSLSKLEENFRQHVEVASNINMRSNNYNFHVRSKQLNPRFGAVDDDINGSGISEVDLLLRFISDASVSDIAETIDDNNVFLVAASSSSSACCHSVIVPEPDGLSVRIYDGEDKLVGKEVTFCHCSRCDDLCQKSEGDFSPAILKVENDLVVDMYPLHHPECSATSLESLRELGDDLKNFCVVANHRIISLKAVIESEFTVLRDPGESFVINESDQQNWDAPIMDEDILMNSASLPKVPNERCCCRRIYEENMELYQEMLRSVDEMRSLVSEMKRISGVSTEYYVEDGQILEQGDNSALYVVNE